MKIKLSHNWRKGFGKLENNWFIHSFAMGDWASMPLQCNSDRLYFVFALPYNVFESRALQTSSF
ncbi:unnamed protein product [Fusarium graminearum]|uniref:Chromosome 1, complete genome n=1 Tax=Gibberella zeae (strain ATCC MYA-4620 / CBS 123657 / FGSC 9075 / NRRL 31084 / PH-1) TaxID=229533 RepID=A0A098DB32_GIBZE|nr:unnamed protein product [Fusarium graminearum]CZS78951.1 unnamed protein product [Fusarium graminearum]